MSIQTQEQARFSNAEQRYFQLRDKAQCALNVAIFTRETASIDVVIASRNKAEELLTFAALSCLPEHYVRAANRLLKQAAHLVAHAKRERQR